MSSASSSASSPSTPVTPLDLHGPRFFFGGDFRDASSYEPPEFPHVAMTPPLHPSDFPPFAQDKSSSTEVTVDVDVDMPMTPAPEIETEQDVVMDYDPIDSDSSAEFAHSALTPADLPSRPPSPITEPSAASEIHQSVRTVRPKSSSSGKSAPSGHKKSSSGKSKIKHASEALSPGRPESAPHRRHREKAHKCPVSGFNCIPIFGLLKISVLLSRNRAV